MIIEINDDNIKNLNFVNLDIEVIISELNNNPFGKYLFYVLDNTLVGYLYYSDIYDRIEINDFLIFDEFKRNGYGFKLINYLIAKDKDISLEVNSLNVPAISLYKKVGFKEVAIRKNYYNGVDGILMVYEKK